MRTNKFKLKPGLLFIALFLISTILFGFISKKNSKDLSATIASEVPGSENCAVDSEAVELLQRGLSFLSKLEKFSVQTQNTYEDILNNTYRVDYETSASLSVNRPNKIRIERHGLEMHQIFYYDGESFALNNPDDKVYATKDFPGNVEDMFHFVRDTFGISGPSADLVYTNSFSLLIEDVNLATVIGKEMIGDVMCDHLLFSRPDVSFQIWISEREPYLPYKYVVTDITTPQLLSNITVMKNWNTAPALPESMFRFTPPKGSIPIQLLKVNQSTDQ